MIIEFECLMDEEKWIKKGIFDHCMCVFGKKCNINDLRKKLFETLAKEREARECQKLREDRIKIDFVDIFCRMWNFDIIPKEYWSTTPIDFTVDLDCYFVCPKGNMESGTHFYLQ